MERGRAADANGDRPASSASARSRSRGRIQGRESVGQRRLRLAVQEDEGGQDQEGEEEDEGSRHPGKEGGAEAEHSEAGGPDERTIRLVNRARL